MKSAFILALFSLTFNLKNRSPGLRNVYKSIGLSVILAVARAICVLLRDTAEPIGRSRSSSSRSTHARTRLRERMASYLLLKQVQQPQTKIAIAYLIIYGAGGIWRVSHININTYIYMYVCIYMCVCVGGEGEVERMSM